MSLDGLSAITGVSAYESYLAEELEKRDPTKTKNYQLVQDSDFSDQYLIKNLSDGRYEKIITLNDGSDEDLVFFQKDIVDFLMSNIPKEVSLPGQITIYPTIPFDLGFLGLRFSFSDNYFNSQSIEQRRCLNVLDRKLQTYLGWL